MAVLEHFLRFSHDATSYEQSELIRFLITWATAKRRAELKESELLDILQVVAHDESRHLAVRAKAAMNLPVVQQPNMGKLMLDILRSETVCDESQHRRVVNRALEYLGEHPPGEQELHRLKQLPSQAIWKTVAINQLLGIAVAEDASHVEHAKDLGINL